MDKQDLDLYGKMLYALHQSNKYKEFEPAYIFIKKDIDHYKVQITAINKNDPEDGMIYKTDETVKANLDDSINVYPLFEWQWNIDEDIFEILNDGYQIDFMDMTTHYGIWTTINDWGLNEIECKEGLNKYILFCKNNGISAQTIKSTVGHDIKDIYPLYHEHNNNYQIICENECSDQAIVLAYNKKAPQSFVTWETTKSREYGYNMGHYFSDYPSAYKDYTSRCHQMLDRYLTANKMRSKGNKEHER